MADMEAQAKSWIKVWELCYKLGMRGGGNTGQEQVLLFIAKLAKKAKVKKAIQAIKEDAKGKG